MVWAPQAYMLSSDGGSTWGGDEQQPGDDSACRLSRLWSLLEWPRQRPSPQGKFLDISSFWLLM
ncbi:hypothetical protein TYRP_020122 [Tyrophagus putrescentiae]|nr:hypothetical protein TYRP_020122 [Tyrophagus putrescentiae]